MTGELALWAVQTAIVIGLSIVGWSVKRLLSDLERKIESSERRAQEMVASLRAEMIERGAEIRRETEGHSRRCEVIQGRLSTAEQRGAADQAVLRQVSEQLSVLAERIDAVYRILTERAK